MPRHAPRSTGAGGNRTDVGLSPLAAQPPGQPNGIPAQANVQPTGLPYGEAGQLHAAQSAAPVPDLMQAAIQAAKVQFPGKDQRGITPLDAPTERPEEHITTGTPGPFGSGPPVPSLAAPGGPVPTVSESAMADLLSQLADITGSKQLQDLAARAKAGN